ncbi:MAG TPA: hypothetical protein VN612_01730, partial [Acidobacteriaceae bacterium]|nr:hypothetical protein [Acidobacteriaceae bacterium]
MHPSRAVRIAAIASVLLGPLALRAQSTQQAIEARLKDHPLYLRGQWQPNRLKFDSAGNLLTGAQQSPFTLAGIDVTRVKYKKDHLEIDGDRVGLEFLATGPKRLSLQ